MPFKKLKTGVRGFDEVTGGGLPEFSFNLIAGSPGSGKTTLAHQMMFTNATPERPALYFTVLGEPTLKMLRYQQQFSFFKNEMVNKAVHYINLSDAAKLQDFDFIMEQIANEVRSANPSMVFVDSFRTVARQVSPEQESELKLQSFVENLAIFLTSQEATTFLIGEYSAADMQNHPVFTVADGIFWLSQSLEANSILRKMRIVKIRGQEQIPGLHTFRITNSGLQVFPRTFGLLGREQRKSVGKRLSLGVPGLDRMLFGGIPQGDSVLVTGPTGSGKSVLARQFIAEGLKHNEPAIVALFEERPYQYTGRVKELGLDLETPQEQGILKVLTLRPLDLSVDEAIQDIFEAVNEIGARRLVIDSLASLELALTPDARQEFRQALYRMMRALSGAEVTIMNTIEVPKIPSGSSFDKHSAPFLTDDIIQFRHVERDGKLQKTVVVVKMRGSDHSKEIRNYDINTKGLVIGDTVFEQTEVKRDN